MTKYLCSEGRFLDYNLGIMPITSETPEKPEWVHVFKNVGKVFTAGIGFLILVAVVLGLCEALDEGGYVPHKRTLDVYLTSDWLVGENRACVLVLQNAANGNPSGKLDNLQCPIELGNLNGGLAPHNVTVTFKGVIDPYDMNGKARAVPDRWTCKRGSDDFTCHPLVTSTNPAN